MRETGKSHPRQRSVGKRKPGIKGACLFHFCHLFYFDRGFKILREYLDGVHLNLEDRLMQ